MARFVNGGDRRQFLKDLAGASGLVFAGCGLATLSAQSRSSASAAQHPPVILRGRRIRTVDIHAHCLVPAAANLLNRQVNRQALLPMDGQALAQRIAVMDAQGIDMAVLSINPNWYDVDRDLAVRVVSLQNERMAEFCRAHADRFAAFASVALQFPDLAAQQLEEAATQLGFRGVAIGSNVAGRELADETFHPFWARAEALGAVVFIHPQASADVANRLTGNGALTNVAGNPFELAIALSHLIFEGTLDRFPGLKICAAHGGGYLPSYMHRADHGCEVFPEQCAPGIPRKHPTEYLKQFYYDSLVFTPEGLRHLAVEVGAGRIMVGTDYPYPWVRQPIEHVLTTPGLTDADREAILGGTATKLLGLVSRG